MSKKIKLKRKKNFLNKWQICMFLIIILLFVSTSYSLWSSNLYVYGSVLGERKEADLPITVPPQETQNGVNRFTSNTTLTALGREIYKVTNEEYSGNTITTTIQHIYKQSTSFFYVSPTITLTLPNNTSSDFTEGKIELVEQNDANGIFQNVTYKISSDIITAGNTSTATISGTLKGNLTVADNTYYNFKISYKVNGSICYFNYNIIFLPI